MNRSHIPVTKSDADFINGINTIDDCRTGTYGNQGIHIGRTVEQSLESHAIVFEIDKYHRDQQKKLGKCKTHRIFHAQQKTGQGPAHHVTHRDIKQRYRKERRQQKPLFHLLIFCLRCAGFRLCCRGSRVAFRLCRSFWKRTISGFFNCLDNSRRVQNRLIIRSNHAILQQIDGHFFDAGELAHALFNPGRAGRASHTRNVKLLLLQKLSLLSFWVLCEYPPPVGH